MHYENDRSARVGPIGRWAVGSGSTIRRGGAFATGGRESASRRCADRSGRSPNTCRRYSCQRRRRSDAYSNLLLTRRRSRSPPGARRRRGHRWTAHRYRTGIAKASCKSCSPRCAVQRRCPLRPNDRSRRCNPHNNRAPRVFSGDGGDARRRHARIEGTLTTPDEGRGQHRRV